MVSARILRHIARGIYRSPAGALKELISNSFDAGAQTVTINTGYPVFKKIIATDNGKGMSKTEFSKIVNNIGLSTKAVGTKFKLKDGTPRETIGHYGIGLLAVGQLCGKLIIRSKISGSLTGFCAELDFEQFEIKRVGKIERSLIKDEKIIESDEDEFQNGNKKLAIGTCKIREEYYRDSDKNNSYTKLELLNIRSFVQTKLSGKLNISGQGIEQRYFANFEELLKLYKENEDSLTQGQYPYVKLLWELGMYCPVEYPDIPVFQKDGKLHYFQELALKNQFNIVVDGIKIYKPYLKDFFDDRKFPIKDFFCWENEAYICNRKKYNVSAFLILRQRIRPKSMQGVLVRQSGIAVGKYDLTYMAYPFHQGTKFEQITGEIFANGLAGALNIDRDSFNETDDNFLALSDWFHKKLKDVFKEFSNILIKQSREDLEQEVIKIIKLHTRNKQLRKKVLFKKSGKEYPLFDLKKDTLIINSSHIEARVKRSNFVALLLASLLYVDGKVTSIDIQNMFKEIQKLISS